MIWHLDHVVWAIALTLSATPTPTPEPVTVPVVVTSSMTEAAPQPVADPAPVVDVEATIDLHTKQLRDFHVAYEASVFAYAAHGSVSVVDWLRGDLDKMRWWQSEWQAAGAPNQSVSDEYVDVIARHQALIARIENDHE